MSTSINNNFMLRYKSAENLGKSLGKGNKEKTGEAKVTP